MTIDNERKTYISTHSPEEWRQLLNEFDEIIGQLKTKIQTESRKAQENSIGK